MEFLKLWLVLKSLYDTPSIATWFLFMMADSFFLYLFAFVRRMSQDHPQQQEPSKEESEKIKYKFIAMFLYTIGFILTLIFSSGKGDREVALLSVLVHALSLLESVITRMNKEGGQQQQFMKALYEQTND